MMASYPCTDDPREIIDAIVGAGDNAEKFDRWVNGGVYEEVQLGAGQPTPTIRNVVHLVKSAASTLDGSDVSGKFADAANGGTVLRTLADRFGDYINVRDFGARGDGITDDTAAIQAALAESCRGGIWFPHGVYVITEPLEILNDSLPATPIDGAYNVNCVTTLNLDGSALVWGGANGADHMIRIRSQSCTLCNGRIVGAPLNAPGDTHVVKTPVIIWNDPYTGAQHQSTFNVRICDLAIVGYSESGLRIGDDEHRASYGTIVDRVYITANNSIDDWEDDGPAGIDLWGSDCKFSNVITQRNKRHVWVHSAGHQFVNCHFVSTPKHPYNPAEAADNSQCLHSMPETAAFWYSYNASQIHTTAYNLVDNCYFDNVKYVVYCDISSRTATQISNSFFFNAGRNFDPAYAPQECFMLGGPAEIGQPINAVNFAVRSGGYIRFLSGIECSPYSLYSSEEYIPNVSSSSVFACPWLAKHKVQNGQSARLLATEIGNGETHCIGGVMVPSLGYAVFRLHFVNATFGEIDVEWKNVGGVDTNWQCVVHRSWATSAYFRFEIRKPMTVSIRGTSLVFVPICVTNLYGSAWTGHCRATLSTPVTECGLYLVSSQGPDYELSALSASGISISGTIVSSAVMQTSGLYNVVPFIPGENSSIATPSLNSIRTTGVYPVALDGNTEGTPFEGYGLLEVWSAPARAGVASAPVTLQRITSLYGTAAVWQRNIAGNPATPSEWVRVTGS